MKSQIALRPELHLLKIRYPHIHPDDAWNALVARTKQRFKDRRFPRTAKQVEELFEDVFLAVLSDVPPQQWLDDTWQAIQERVQASKVGNFWKRLARATGGLSNRRRKLLFDEVDLFLLNNWRVLRFPNPDNPRGLSTWPSCDVLDLLDRKGIPGRSSDMKWYQNRRHRLGLTSSSPSVPKFPGT